MTRHRAQRNIHSAFIIAVLASSCTPSPTRAARELASETDGLTPFPPADGDRRTFAREIILGARTSAFQIEGAKGNRAPSVWDAFAGAKLSESRASEWSRGIDFYARYVADVDAIANTGAKAFKMSLSWPRLMRADGTVIEEGFEYYRDLIEKLQTRDVEPRVTLFHWDAPTWLCANDDAVTCDGAWLEKQAIDHFEAYADAAFARLGASVKVWTTIAEPRMVANLGYGEAQHAPGRRSETEKLIAGHNMLLAHARVAQLYKTKYAPQRGRISIDLNAEGDDAEALAWFADPLFFGDYPLSMRARLGEHLPKFADSDKRALLGSVDFLALTVAAAVGSSGLEKVLRDVRERYGDVEIVVTDDGVVDEGSLQDDMRVAHIDATLDALRAARKGGVNVAAYFYGAMFDDVDWIDGVATRRGLVYVDHENGMKRMQKASLEHFSSLARARSEPTNPMLGARVSSESAPTFVRLGTKRSGETLAIRGFLTAITAVVLTAAFARAVKFAPESDERAPLVEN